MSKKNIIFVGDSYCSSFVGPGPIGHTKYQSGGAGGVLTWLDISANDLNLDLYCFGYAGRSWWNSRWHLMRYLDGAPDTLGNTDVMVFVHTDSMRYNTVEDDIGNELLVVPPAWSSNPAAKARQQIWAPALKSWVTDLLDVQFQDWCHSQWIEEINRMHDKNPNLKIIHFNAFPSTVDKTQKASGMVFTTPLIHISLGEAEGTDEFITTHYMINDQRANHFSEWNNMALGKIVVDAVMNYTPGTRTIDTAGFKLINSNSHKWPSPGFGTQ